MNHDRQLSGRQRPDSLENIRNYRRGGYRIRRNEKGETELHRACINGEHKMVERLLTKGHPVNEKDNGGWTCLHEACNWGHTDIARMLIEHGANVDAKGMGNVTPLLDAAANGQFEIVDLLVNAGASLAHVDSEGNTVLDLLQSYKNNTDEMTHADEDEYKRITTTLRDRMSEAGIRLHRSIKQLPGTSTGTSRRATRQQNTRSRAGVDEYTTAISTVGRSAAKRRGNIFDYAAFNASRRSRTVTKSASSKSGLVTETEYEVSDDWMIDDLNGHYIRTESGNKKARCGSTGRVISPTESGEMECSFTSDHSSPVRVNVDDCFDPEIPNHQNNSATANDSDDDLVVIGRRSERKQTKKRGRLVQSRLNLPATPSPSNDDVILDQMDERERGEIAQIAATSNVPTVQTEAQEIQNVPARSMEIVRVNVTVEGQKFAVILDNRNHTIGWLTEKVTSSYESANGKRPVIRLFTTDDAALNVTDTVEFLFYRNEQLIGKIDRFEVLAMEDSYRRVCQRMKQNVCDDICAVFRNAAESTTLDFRHTSLRACGGSTVILKALQADYHITSLNLRGQRLTSTDATELGRTLGCLNHLSDLVLTCIGIHCDQLLALATEMCREREKRYVLEKIDFSFNLIGDSSAAHLSRIFLRCPYLKVVRLQCIGATSRFVQHYKTSLKEAFSTIQLEHLDMSRNRLGDGVSDLRAIFDGLERYVDLKLY